MSRPPGDCYHCTLPHVQFSEPKTAGDWIAHIAGAVVAIFLVWYFRVPDKPWQRAPESAEISGMHHNVLGGFLDVRPAVYACGTGKATLRNFRYWPVNLDPTSTRS